MEINHPIISCFLKQSDSEAKKYMPYEMRPRDIERRLFACGLLIEKQKRKGFCHVIGTRDKNHGTIRASHLKGPIIIIKTSD